MHGHANVNYGATPQSIAPKATPVLQRMEGVNISLTELRGKLQTLCNRLGVGTPANDVAAPPLF